MLRNDYNLLTIDLSMFGEGGGEGAAPAGEASAPAGEASAPAAAAAPAPAEVRYGKQPRQEAVPQQEPTQASETPPDKGKLFADLIKGEYKDQYTEATQKLINRRFRESDAKIQAQQPIMDLLASRYGIEDRSPESVQKALEDDIAFWDLAGEPKGLTGKQYLADLKRDILIGNYTRRENALRAYQQAQRQNAAWEAEAVEVSKKYPEFNIREWENNDVFQALLRNKFSVEDAYIAANARGFAAKAAAAAQKATTDNIKARGNRPAEAGAKASPAFTVKDDVSKLSSKEVLDSFNRILGGERISFSR